MSSYFDDASLVMIPSGYKTSKVYSVKPTDGTGDLTFTRSNDTATRVASNGLIEKVRTNLNPNGNLVGLALNTSPTGYTNFNTGTFEPVTNTTSSVGTFCKFTTSGTRSFFDRTFTGLTIGQAYTFSYKVQAISGSINLNQTFSFFSGATTSSYYINGVASPIGAAAVATGLIYVVGVATSTSISIRIGNGVSGSTTAVLEIGNFQLESGDIATDYIVTTTAAVSVGLVANVPRLDYLNSSCPRLLLEPQTTALNQFSEQLNDAYWSKTNCTVTANQTASPSGYVDAELILDNTLNDQHAISRSIAVTSGNKYTASFFLKAAGRTTAAIRMGTGSLWAGGGGPTVEFNLTALTGTVVEGSGVTFTIEDYGNGWRRCSVTGTCVTSGNTAYSLFVKQYFAYIGNGTDGIYAWGANITATGYVQSYIPTLGAAVTRGADSASKTGISSLIGQTEGTLFAEFSLTNYNSVKALCTVDVGATTNFIAITLNSGNPRLTVRQAGSSSVLLTPAQLPFGNYKLAVGYKSGDYVMYINGVQVGTSSSTVYPVGALTQYVLNNASYGELADSVSQAILFPTRLSNSDLAALTA